MNSNLATRATKVVAAAAISVSLALGVAGTAFAGAAHAQSHQGRAHGHGFAGRHHGGSQWNTLKGTVTAFDSTSHTITITGRHGVSVTYTTTGSTTFAFGSTSATASEVAVGEHVVLTLTSPTPQMVAGVTIELSRVQGTVTAINGSVVSITGHHGVALTVNTSGTTTYTLNGATSTFGAIVVGSKIVAAGLPDTAPLTLDATKIWIKAPCTHVLGTVTGVDATTNTIMVESHRGVPVAYTTTGTTTYFAGKTAATSGAVMIGEHVTLTLTSTMPQTVTNVLIHLQAVVGSVSAITGSVLSVTGLHGTTYTVNTSGTTTYTQDGASSTFGAIRIGSNIAALGLRDTAPSTLDASAIYIFVGGFSHHHSGHGHHGRH